MHDIKAIRENPQSFVDGWSKRNYENPSKVVEVLLDTDADLRAAKTAFETNQAQLKKLHQQYLDCGVRNRNDLAQMRKYDPSFSGKNPRF